jgi:hypothetical protein
VVGDIHIDCCYQAVKMCFYAELVFYSYLYYFVYMCLMASGYSASNGKACKYLCL